MGERRIRVRDRTAVFKSAHRTCQFQFAEAGPVSRYARDRTALSSEGFSAVLPLGHSWVVHLDIIL